jgi:L-alanine-DL-glutamate epimerase-like enolase superfamily enzyme
MELIFTPFALPKRRPLAISRGTSPGSVNVWVRIIHDAIEGWGEAGPNGVTQETTASILTDLALVFDALADLAPDRVPQDLLGRLRPAARAGLTMALDDWTGKRAGVPLWKIYGLDRNDLAPISGTVGIATPERAVIIAQEWLDLGVQVLKIKLGSPAGIDADRAMMQAIRDAVPDGTALRVDANGGWTPPDARTMIPWLATLGVEYVEQPLPRGREADLPLLRPAALPIFADESVWTAADVEPLVGAIDGVNVKLMKCGGIDEACRIVDVARSHGLQTMLGCMSESSLSITAGAQIGPLFDHLDLDSHLNLIDDPFLGAKFLDGRVVPGDGPGLGVVRRPDVGLLEDLP